MTAARRRRARGTSLARRADKHDLYRRAVQSPEHDVAFVERVARAHAGRAPTRLREDFCGTAMISATFVGRGPRHEAWAVDLDPAPLAWSETHVRAPLGPAARRLHLIHGDALRVETPRCDVVLAGNFSFFTLKDRAALLAYFRHVRETLRPGGVFVGDVVGGPECMMVMRERRRVGSFTYEWEHERFDPISCRLKAHVTFRFRDGSALRRAFSYDWRIWSVPEVREALHEAGFSRTSVYWELTDARGSGLGILRRAEAATACEAFIASIAAAV